MSIKIDSLKRLYSSGKITAEEVNALITVSAEEKEKIITTQPDTTVQELMGYLYDLGVDTSET